MGQQAPLVFDHEQDSRPRRQVADWGGDEVFARTPRRRFRAVQGASEDAHSVARAHVTEPVRPRLQAVPAPAPAPDPAPAPAPAAPAEVAPAELRWEDERAPNGRRTVVITGRPGPLQAAATRRRPPRTVEERVGARPDRVAAWACGLGVTLILTAVATADAAVRGL